MMRRLFVSVAKVAGVVLLAACVLWFLPVILPHWLNNPPELVAWRKEKRQKRKRWEHWQKLCQWEAREKRDRFKRIEKMRKNFYK